MFGLKKKQELYDAQRNAEAENKLRDKVRQLLERDKWTPDMAQLARYQSQLVFLADEFQVGHPKHELIKNYSAYLGKVTTTFPFVVWKRSLGDESYPIPMQAAQFSRAPWENPRKGDALVVRGELFAVMPTKVIPLLDKHRQNGLQFRRERVQVQLRYRERSYSLRDGWHHSEWKVETITAWMYMGEPDYWNWEGQSLGYMDHVQMFKPNDDSYPQYYKFTLKEYGD